ncbi:MAG: CHAT domain-containing protein [Lachnospiraceae bacterium]|nr:CHAT domain-containing protein [Lachnospiraceae bacterium]
MEFNTDRVKEQWLEDGFLAGVVLCEFLEMQEQKLDIVYDKGAVFVERYADDLGRLLETANREMILLADTELQYCMCDYANVNQKAMQNGYINELEEAMLSEIYLHFVNSGREYPDQLVGMHVNIASAVHAMGLDAPHYVQQLRHYYLEIWGRNGFWFCRNWCAFIYLYFIPVVPDFAIEEFERYHESFQENLIDEAIYYTTSLSLRSMLWDAKKISFERFRKDVYDCENMLKQASAETQEALKLSIELIHALMFRNLGRGRDAIPGLTKAFYAITVPEGKLHCLVQIMEISYKLGLKDEISVCINVGKELVQIVGQDAESAEDRISFYMLCALYYVEIGEENLAIENCRTGMEICGNYYDEDSDFGVLCKANGLLVEARLGYDVQEEFDEILGKVAAHPEVYPRSFSLVKNNAMGIYPTGDKVDSFQIFQLKQVVKNQEKLYNKTNEMIFQCNFYLKKMLRDKEYFPFEFENELDTYFERNPEAEGYVQYLQIKILKHHYLNDETVAYRYMRSLDDYFSCRAQKSNSGAFAYSIKFRLAAYDHDDERLCRLAEEIWENNIQEMFQRYYMKRNEQYLTEAQQYMALFISAVMQLDGLRDQKEYLCSCIAKCKYLYKVAYREPDRLEETLKLIKTWEMDEALKTYSLVLEMYDYTLTDFGSLTDDGQIDMEHKITQVCFLAIKDSNGKMHTEVFYNLQKELSLRIWYGYEERDWNMRENYVRKVLQCREDVKTIYFSMNLLTEAYPFALWGTYETEVSDCFQIVYISCMNDMKCNPQITKSELSRSLFIGYSRFEEEIQSSVQTYRQRLSTVQSEIRYLAKKFSARGMCDKDISDDVLNDSGNVVLHFSTHTSNASEEEPTGICIRSDGKERVLYLDDVAKYDWSNVKLVVFSACASGMDMTLGGLREGARLAGAQCCVSTFAEVEDWAALFFAICFYEHVYQEGNLIEAFASTQQVMRNITKGEILKLGVFLKLGFADKLKNYNDDDIPFYEDADCYMFEIL